MILDFWDVFYTDSEEKSKMEELKDKNEQKMQIDETDYIDIPAFIRSFLRYTRKYILFAVPLIICMSVFLAVFSKPYAKKDYIAGGTAIIGVQLSDSLSFDYTFSELSWDRLSTLAQMNSVLNALMESGYITQSIKDYMRKPRDEELNGQIYINTAYATNLIDIYVISDSSEDAEAIRDAVFACLPDAVSPAVGFIKMDIQEMYTREESSSKAFLTSPKVWAAGGFALGIIGYLGLVFLYTLRRRDVETPKDLRDLTDLPCIGRLPALKRRTHRRKDRTDDLSNYLVVTKEYQRAFDLFRRTVEEEIRKHQSRVILLTGNGHRKGQSTIASELDKAWRKMEKNVILKDLTHNEDPLTEEKVRSLLDQCDKDADFILIDGPSCDQSADPLVLADCADVMIIVIREGQSQPDELREMFQSLQYVNANSLGYVLNICSITVT